MRKRLIVISTCLILMSLAGCAKGGKVVTPQPLTPEQRLAIYKIGAQTAAAGLAVRVASLEKDATANAQKIRILKAAKSILDEFNVQVAGVVAIDLTSRETIKRAVDKALAAADNLTAKDILELKDAAAQADIGAAIAVAIARMATNCFGVTRSAIVFATGSCGNCVESVIFILSFILR